MPLYFAYGSNINQLQMQKRCPEHTRLGVFRLPGYRLAFSKYSGRWHGGVADIISDSHDEVWGVLYDLTDRDIALLDRKEGSAYRRFQTDVVGPNGIVPDVWVYEVRDKQHTAPSRTYLDFVIRAATDHLPGDYVRRLEQWVPEAKDFEQEQQ